MAKKTFIFYAVLTLLVLTMGGAIYKAIYSTFDNRLAYYISQFIHLLPYILAPVGACSYVRMKYQDVAGDEYSDMLEVDPIAIWALVLGMSIALLFKSMSSPMTNLVSHAGTALMLFSGYRFFMMTSAVKTKDDYVALRDRRRQRVFRHFAEFVLLRRGGVNVTDLRDELAKAKAATNLFLVAGCACSVVLVPVALLILMPLIAAIIIFAFRVYELKRKVRDIEAVLDGKGFSDNDNIDVAISAVSAA
ncbi:hypothetical protein TUM3794_20830 [Shewanella colwelliana]|uniref:ABC transmembrane type-1 domain-containing protein n=1 Tax=Shewanella colwelliana TaxID=23 RepID=A0ABQ4P0W8_SHECO|nr:hypothetical protein [Shewanella colwelliana]GIU41108.1 hypothetical protein TUM3794_20830 [Shewanella colwelliana]